MIDDGSRPASMASSSSRWFVSRRELGVPHVCQTSAYRATSGSVRRGPLPPIQIGGCGCCTGSGRSWASCNETTRPSYDTTSPVNSRVTISSASSSRSNRSGVDGNGMPSSTCSLSNQAAPSESSSRPCDAWSIVSAWAANTEGCRYVTPATSSPRRMRDVTPASAASVVMPSNVSPGPSPYIGSKWSKPQAPSKPRSSANCTRLTTSSHGIRCCATSSPKRMASLVEQVGLDRHDPFVERLERPPSGQRRSDLSRRLLRLLGVDQHGRDPRPRRAVAPGTSAPS